MAYRSLILPRTPGIVSQVSLFDKVSNSVYFEVFTKSPPPRSNKYFSSSFFTPTNQRRQILSPTNHCDPFLSSANQEPPILSRPNQQLLLHYLYFLLPQYNTLVSEQSEDISVTTSVTRALSTKQQS